MSSFVKASLVLCAFMQLLGCADPVVMPQGTGRHTRPCIGDERFDLRCDDDSRRMNSGAGSFGVLGLPVALLAAVYYNASAPSRADQAAARRVIQDETRAR